MLRNLYYIIKLYCSVCFNIYFIYWTIYLYNELAFIWILQHIRRFTDFSSKQIKITWVFTVFRNIKVHMIKFKYAVEIYLQQQFHTTLYRTVVVVFCHKLNTAQILQHLLHYRWLNNAKSQTELLWKSILR